MVVIRPQPSRERTSKPGTTKRRSYTTYQKKHSHSQQRNIVTTRRETHSHDQQRNTVTISKEKHSHNKQINTVMANGDRYQTVMKFNIGRSVMSPTKD